MITMLILGNIAPCHQPITGGLWICSQAAGTKKCQAWNWYGYPGCWFASGFHQCKRILKIQDGNLVNQQHQNHILRSASGKLKKVNGMKPFPISPRSLPAQWIFRENHPKRKLKVQVSCEPSLFAARAISLGVWPFEDFCSGSAPWASRLRTSSVCPRWAARWIG